MPQLDHITLTYITSCTAAFYVWALAYKTARAYRQLTLRRKLRLYALRVTLGRAKVRQKTIFTITNFPHIDIKK